MNEWNCEKRFFLVFSYTSNAGEGCVCVVLSGRWTGHLHLCPIWEREPYHSSHHAPVVRAFWQWRNADQIAVWSHCLHVSQPPSMIMSESCWAPEPGSGLSGPGWFRGWHFPSMTGLVELQSSRPRLMCLSWAPQHSAGSWSEGAQVLPVPVSCTVPPGESQTTPACVCSDTSAY